MGAVCAGNLIHAIGGPAHRAVPGPWHLVVARRSVAFVAGVTGVSKGRLAAGNLADLIESAADLHIRKPGGPAGRNQGCGTVRAESRPDAEELADTVSLWAA
jgi:hypothetical protein